MHIEHLSDLFLVVLFKSSLKPLGILDLIKHELLEIMYIKSTLKVVSNKFHAVLGHI